MTTAATNTGKNSHHNSKSITKPRRQDSLINNSNNNSMLKLEKLVSKTPQLDQQTTWEGML